MVEAAHRFVKLKLLADPSTSSNANAWLVRWNGGPNDKKLCVLKIPKNGEEGYKQMVNEYFLLKRVKSLSPEIY
jgi:hypothetical protein